jgi:hypothetical protein
MKSDTIVKKVASLVRAEKHKVDLGKPDKVVLVEVFQVCMRACSPPFAFLPLSPSVAQSSDNTLDGWW